MQKSDPCILCGASEFIVTHQKNQWQYLCCQNCQLISIHPRPTAQVIIQCYRNYLPEKAMEIDKWKKLMQPVNHQSADLIEARAKHKKGKLIDIGCGYGFFSTRDEYPRLGCIRNRNFTNRQAVCKGKHGVKGIFKTFGTSIFFQSCI